ncbi:MAG TPA: hypothetical protein VGB82_00395 [Alphaproteobacteria bacterium]
MPWHSVTMRTDFADLEVEGFMREITAAHIREITSGANTEYRLYRRKAPNGEQIVIIPPDAVHLAEQTRTWGKQLKQLSSPPSLVGFSEVKVRPAIPPDSSAKA